jgi:hypothetical protein
VKPRTRSDLKKELHKLVVARSDFLVCRKTCKLVLEKVSGFGDELYLPLFHAAVIAYARPYVDNKTTGVLSRHWTRFANPELQQTHDDLLKTRHELVAHSDSKARSIKIVPPGYRAVESLPASEHVGLTISSYYLPGKRFVDAYNTCGDLLNRLNPRIDELLSALYDDQQLPPEPFPLDFSDGL